MAIKIGINGFGRIGRLVYRAAARARRLRDRRHQRPRARREPRLSAQVRHHARPLPWNGKARGGQRDGRLVHRQRQDDQDLSRADPAALPWKDLGVDYVLESTGLFTKGEDAEKHIEAGRKRVVISAPTKSPDTVKTDVLQGQRRATTTPRATRSSPTRAAPPTASRRSPRSSSTTSASTEGLMTTIHAATATQPTQDGPSKKDFAAGATPTEHHPRAAPAPPRPWGCASPRPRASSRAWPSACPVADVSRRPDLPDREVDRSTRSTPR